MLCISYVTPKEILNGGRSPSEKRFNWPEHFSRWNPKFDCKSKILTLSQYFLGEERKFSKSPEEFMLLFDGNKFYRERVRFRVALYALWLDGSIFFEGARQIIKIYKWSAGGRCLDIHFKLMNKSQISGSMHFMYFPKTSKTHKYKGVYLAKISAQNSHF